MSVAVIDCHLFGGTCVDLGCMPTKTLVASAYAAHLAGAMPNTASFSISRRVKARADTVRQIPAAGVENCAR